MKKMLSYIGLLVLAGVIFGGIVTGLVWMQHLYDLSVSYYLFTAAFWLGMAATVLFGIWLRRYYQQLSKVWVFFSVLSALFSCYLFPQFLTPKCSEIPTVKARCETVCVPACSKWVDFGEPGCTDEPANPWDDGCCLAYDAQKCEEVCYNDPPNVSGSTTCTEFGANGWCTAGGQLHMNGSDPDGDPITISGTMVGQAFTCPSGNSCIYELIEGNGAAVFHAYDGELSSGNFSVNYKFDATAPTLSPAVVGTAGSNGWYTSYVNVSTNAVDLASGVMISKIRLLTTDWQDSLDFNTDGIYTVEMSALDNAGNESTQQAQIMVDTVDPVPNVQVDGTKGINSWYRSDVTWWATATDATSGMASIEVNVDGGGWTAGDTVMFTAEGAHTLDYRFTDAAGNAIVTNHAFSIDKTAPAVTINYPAENNILSLTVAVKGNASDGLSGLMEVAVSPDGGATWHMVPWEADGSWQYDWDTTQGPNGVFALIARAVDEAGNITTDQVNVIVDNAPPTVTLTEAWEIWETARASVFNSIIPLGSINITVECGDQPNRVYDYNANNGAFDFKWDRRCGDGNLAPSGKYTVVLTACDIYDNCDEARGKANIPIAAPLISTSTPMPTLEKTEIVQQWYSNPTLVPSTTPTPTEELAFPVLPLTGDQQSPDNDIPTGNTQPLLPLAAAAVGTSVLLAASSRKEEEPQTESTVKVSSLSALAGVVKTGFDGIWNEAVRISAADASTEKSRRVYYVGIEDPQEVLRRQQELAALAAAQKPTKTMTAIPTPISKNLSVTSASSTSYSYQDLLYGNGTTKGVMGTSMGYTSTVQTKTGSVSSAKSTTTSKPGAASTNTVSPAKTTNTGSGGLLGWISDKANAVVNTVKEKVTTTANNIVNKVQSTATTVKEAVTTFVNDPVGTIKNTAAKMGNAVTSTAKTVVNAVTNTVKTAATTLKNNVTSFVSNPSAYIQNAAASVKSTVNNTVSSVKSAVTNTVNTLVNKAQSTTTNVVNTVSAAGVIAGAVVEEIRDENRKDVADTLNKWSASLGSMTDPTLNPYLAADIAAIKGSFNAWGDVWSMTQIISDYTSQAFEEGRWSDGVRGLLGLAEGGNAVMSTWWQAQKIIAEGVITTPYRLFTVSLPRFYTSVRDWGQGKENSWDVLYTGLNFTGDALGTVAMVNSVATRVSVKSNEVKVGNTSGETNSRVGSTPEQIANLKKSVINEYQRLKDLGYSNRQIGPAVAGAYDKTTGKTYFGINNRMGDPPIDMSPIIRERYNGLPQEVIDSYTFTHGAGSHAEIFAVNEALLANPSATINDILVYVIKTKGNSMPIGEVPFPTCNHCSFILEGFEIVSNCK